MQFLFMKTAFCESVGPFFMSSTLFFRITSVPWKLLDFSFARADSLFPPLPREITVNFLKRTCLPFYPLFFLDTPFFPQRSLVRVFGVLLGADGPLSPVNVHPPPASNIHKPRAPTFLFEKRMLESGFLYGKHRANRNFSPAQACAIILSHLAYFVRISFLFLGWIGSKTTPLLVYKGLGYSPVGVLLERAFSDHVVSFLRVLIG